MKLKADKALQKKMLNPLFFKLFLIVKLPMAFLAGLRLKELTDSEAVVQMKHKYLNKNPFGSIYFACLAMAGEMASGMLAAAIVYKSKPKISMLVVDMKATFKKKAVGKILFHCKQGHEMLQTIEKSIATGEGQTIDALTIATDQQGDVVAEFIVQWSFKAKS